MRDEYRGRLDRAIDRAVRDMVQIEPRPGLGRRVAERIERPARGWFAFGQRSRGAPRWIPTLAALATLTVLLTSFALYRRPILAPAPAPQLAGSAPQTSPATAADPAAPERVTRPSEPPVSAATRAAAPRTSPAGGRPGTAASIFGQRTGRVSAANIERAPEAAPQGDTETESFPGLPGVVAPLAPITIAPIQVAPITLSPVTVSARPGGR
jgi:hypothetical protein